MALKITLGRREKEIYLFPDKRPIKAADVVCIMYHGLNKDSGSRPQIALSIHQAENYNVIRGRVLEKEGGLGKYLDKLNSEQMESGN